MFIVVDLPEPFSPTRPSTWPAREREADVVQDLDAEEALAETLGLKEHVAAVGADGFDAAQLVAVNCAPEGDGAGASMTAASRMTPPLMAKTEASDRPRSCRPLSMTVRNRTPNTVQMILPLPPNRLTPPITAAPMTSSRMRWPRTGVPVSRRPV